MAVAVAASSDVPPPVKTSSESFLGGLGYTRGSSIGGGAADRTPTSSSSFKHSRKVSSSPRAPLSPLSLVGRRMRSKMGYVGESYMDREGPAGESKGSMMRTFSERAMKVEAMAKAAPRPDAPSSKPGASAGDTISKGWTTSVAKAADRSVLSGEASKKEAVSIGGIVAFHRLLLKHAIIEERKNIKPPPEPHTTTWRDKVTALLDDPASSKGAFFVSVVVTCLIAVSVLATILETVASIRDLVPEEFWFSVEVFCGILFTVEVLARYVVAKTHATFWTAPLNVVDVVAILPFYVEIILIAAGDKDSDQTLLRAFRALRIFRTIRIFKLSRHLSSGQIFVQVVVMSARPLGIMVVVVVLGTVILSTLVYHLEKGSQPEVFSSIPATMWWGLVTVYAVGYGDVVPSTPGGRLLASIAGLFGLVVLAMPISVISAKYLAALRRVETDQAEMTSAGKWLVGMYNRLNTVVGHGKQTAQTDERLKLMNLLALPPVDESSESDNDDDDDDIDNDDDDDDESGKGNPKLESKQLPPSDLLESKAEEIPPDWGASKVSHRVTKVVPLMDTMDADKSKREGSSTRTMISAMSSTNLGTEDSPTSHRRPSLSDSDGQIARGDRGPGGAEVLPTIHSISLIPQSATMDSIPSVPTIDASIVPPARLEVEATPDSSSRPVDGPAPASKPGPGPGSESGYGSGGALGDLEAKRVDVYAESSSSGSSVPVLTLDDLPDVSAKSLCATLPHVGSNSLGAVLQHAVETSPVVSPVGTRAVLTDIGYMVQSYEKRLNHKLEALNHVVQSTFVLCQRLFGLDDEQVQRALRLVDQVGKFSDVNIDDLDIS